MMMGFECAGQHYFAYAWETLQRYTLCCCCCSIVGVCACRAVIIQEFFATGDLLGGSDLNSFHNQPRSMSTACTQFHRHDQAPARRVGMITERTSRVKTKTR